MISRLSAETQALLAAIVPDEGKISTAHTDALYEQTAPIHDALEHVRAKIAEVQRLRRKADATEEDEYGYSFFERIKQTCDAAERISRETLNAVDALRDVCFQLDSYALDMARSIEGRDARLADAAKRTAGVVMLSKDEHEHLLARAAQGENAAIAVAASETIP